MRPDRLAAVIRPRGYAEAIELGFRMVRAWWRPIFGSWALIGLPLFAVLAAVFHTRPGFAALIVWWLKPVFDRAALEVLARGLFGAVPTTRETLRAWPGALRHGLPAALLWMRFDPLRSLRLPPIQLEGQRGAARRARMRLLAREARGEAALLFATCALFELSVATGVIGLLAGLVQPEWLETWFVDGTVVSLPLGAQWIVVVAHVLAMAVIEPFYVAGGFALYVNRRTHLEAWDIEVVFRGLAARLKPAVGAALLVLAVLTLLAPAGAAATDPPPGAVLEAELVETSSTDPDPQEVIASVLADPVFGGERVEELWTFREPERNEPPRWASGLGSFSELIGLALRAAVIGVALLILGWGLYYYARRLPRIESPDETGDDTPAPVTAMGLDVREASLPDDVAGEAGTLWGDGRRADAVRLLYRAALARLISRDGLRLPSSATEGECLRLVAAHRPAGVSAYFRELTGVWQLSAYARRPPVDEDGAMLIEGWSRHFGEEAS